MKKSKTVIGDIYNDLTVIENLSLKNKVILQDILLKYYVNVVIK